MRTVLIVDDDPQIVDTVSEVCRLQGYAVHGASAPAEALERLSQTRIDLLLLDIDLRGDGRDRSGRDLLAQVRKRWTARDLPVIVISGVGDTRLLREVVAAGADDYEVKPIEFPVLLEKIARYLAPERHPAAPDAAAWQEEMVGRSKVIMNVSMAIWQAARQENDVLFLGETGTGKDLAARLYHRYSRRSAERLYEIDCTTITPTLFEAEIFGYVPGAFSEAKRVKKGRIEEADRGIAFFNEIGDLPGEQQSKLLTLLEQKTSLRLGSNEPIQLDVVLLAATNRDLYAMVGKGAFRKDLYYRLSNNVIVIPPLRDHLEDLPLLAEHFIHRYNEAFGTSVQGLAPDLLKRLEQRSWEGNVRQLKNCIGFGAQRCIHGLITWRDVEAFFANQAEAAAPAVPTGPEIPFDQGYDSFKAAYQERTRALVADYFRHHLARHGGNVARTAKALGMTREYLNQLLRQHQVRRDRGLQGDHRSP